MAKNRWLNLFKNRKIGIWIALLLLFNVVTGMFLRPPLLIPIASSRVGKIPLSMLDSDNAWADKLRDLSDPVKMTNFRLINQPKHAEKDH